MSALGHKQTYAAHNGAFASNDIFATADRMKQAGFKHLAISPNYFDDIQARLQLPADLVAKMKANDVLYDRDAGGEYFQFYSQNYGEGFFFEIVQRVGDYNGYGASNAPFRIAAQKRGLQRAFD